MPAAEFVHAFRTITRQAILFGCIFVECPFYSAPFANLNHGRLTKTMPKLASESITGIVRGLAAYRQLGQS